MAVQRYISTSFWDDEWIRSLDHEEKLLYLYLMTNTLTNIAGVYKLADHRITYDVGFDNKTITRIFNRFKRDGKVYRHKEYLIIPTWPKHQKWKSKVKIRDGIISILQELDAEIFEYLKKIDYQFDLSLIDSVVISSKMRRSVSGTTQKKVYEKYHNKCAECGADEDLSLHHVVPLNEGGDNSMENLILLCSECHQKKHSPDTIYGHESQSRYQPNYSDSDSDTDTDPDPDSNTDSDSVLLTTKSYPQVIHRLSTGWKDEQVDDSIPE